jgi:spore coat polysaccharide biosynthesis protein SpsF
MNCKALKTVCAVKEQVDTEIWGYLINRPEIFNVQEMPATQEYVRDNYRLTLDEFDDYRLFKALFNEFPKDTVIDILDAYDVIDCSGSEMSGINNHIIQRDLDQDVIKSIDDYYKKNRNQILEIKDKIYNSI